MSDEKKGLRELIEAIENNTLTNEDKTFLTDSNKDLLKFQSLLPELLKHLPKINATNLLVAQSALFKTNLTAILKNTLTPINEELKCQINSMRKLEKERLDLYEKWADLPLKEAMKNLENWEKENKLNILTKKPYQIQPTSATTNFINKVMNTPPDRADTMKSTNKNKIQTSFENNILTIESKSNSSNIKISIENFIELFKGNDAITSKIFNFILRKSNDQNHDTNIKFNLSDLVDNGLYSNTETARDGIKKALSKLTSIKIKGTHKIGNKEVESGLYVLFTALEIKNSICTVTRNEKININSVCKYLTLLPIWADTLSKNGYSLINYIFYRARQSTADITDKGYFNMKFDTISNALGLPTPEETVKHTEKIINPILEAIKEIETVRDNSKHIGFNLTKHYIETLRSPAEAFLDGYLKVEILDKAKDYFIERENEKIESKKVVKKKRENLATKK